jgi:hypothetical protein
MMQAKKITLAMFAFAGGSFHPEMSAAMLRNLPCMALVSYKQSQ